MDRDTAYRANGRYRRAEGQWLDNLAAALTEDLVDSTQHATILIVDDLEINRRLLGAMLRQEKYRVIEMRSAKQGLEVLEREAVDLVVLDMIMPEMDGLECCRRIRSNRLTELIPVLMLSSVPSVENEIAGIGAGADEFVDKPFHPEVLRTRIRSLLRHKAAVAHRLEESEAILRPWLNPWSSGTATLAATANGWRASALPSGRSWDCRADNCWRSTGVGTCTTSAS